MRAVSTAARGESPVLRPARDQKIACPNPFAGGRARASVAAP